MDELRPFPLANRRMRRQRFVGDERIYQRAGLTQAVYPITAPRIVFGTRDDPSPQRICLDGAHDGQQVFVVLDDQTLESALPHVAAGAMVSMILLRVRNQQALHDTTDRRAAGPNQ